MILLALDLSTKSTGYAIYNNKDLVAHNCIAVSGNDLFYRITQMTQTIEKILQQYQIDFVIIEDVLPDDVHHNQAVYKALTYLQGFVLERLNHYHIPSHFFTASEWRKKCGIQTGRGVKRDTLKTKDVEFVKQHFKIDVNDDEADAICIGFAYIKTTQKDEEDFILV